MNPTGCALFQFYSITKEFKISEFMKYLLKRNKHKLNYCVDSFQRYNEFESKSMFVCVCVYMGNKFLKIIYYRCKMNITQAHTDSNNIRPCPHAKSAHNFSANKKSKITFAPPFAQLKSTVKKGGQKTAAHTNTIGWL